MAIFWGERDFVFDRTFLAKWEERFPDAEVHSYPDVGHYIPEDMKNEVIPHIAEFLACTDKVQIDAFHAKNSKSANGKKKRFRPTNVN